MSVHSREEVAAVAMQACVVEFRKTAPKNAFRKVMILLADYLQEGLDPAQIAGRVDEDEELKELLGGETADAWLILKRDFPLFLLASQVVVIQAKTEMNAALLGEEDTIH